MTSEAWGNRSEQLDEATRREERRWIGGLGLVITIGLVTTILFASVSAGAGGRFAAGTAGLLLGGACLLVGGLAGFLFGIPRALQRDESEGAQAASQPGYRANTNLEQISDWLTKILVGVGLTQLGGIKGALSDAGQALGPALGGATAAAAVAQVAIVFFATSGFIFAYLWTRLFLLGLLTQADLRGVLHEVTQLVTQQDRDVDAYGLVYQFLNSTAPSVDHDKLVEAIRGTSPNMRQQIFTLGADTRRDNWQDPLKKSAVERTIPVFRALIAAVGTKPPHEYLGQLGYALKDKPVPEWQAAHAQLTEAIEARGPWESAGWVTYEANRAECAIELDPAFKANQPSSQEVKQRIVEDLIAASTWHYTEDWLQRPPYSVWMTLNKVTASTLAGSP